MRVKYFKPWYLTESIAYFCVVHSLHRGYSMSDDKLVYSIAEWCIAAKISPGLYFKEKREGRGPRVAHTGRRAIVIESPREYYRRVAQPQVAEVV
jgi:hypothetical protein